MASEREMVCRELVELVTDYLESALSEVDRDRFEEHLGVCPGCRRYYEQIRQTIRAAGRVEPDAVPPATSRQLLQVFRAWRGSRDPESGR